MASIINASTSIGLVTTADTSGVLQLQTGGTTAVTVDASQLVGIGTASPNSKLEVTSRITASDGGGASRIALNIESNTSAQTYSGINSYNYGTSTARNLVLNESGGNVGIGTISPNTKLEVSNGALMAGTSGQVLLGRVSSSFPSTTTTGYFSLDTNNVDGSNGGLTIKTLASNVLTERARIDSSGNLLVGTTSGSNHVVLKDSAVGSVILGITNTGQNTAMFYGTDAVGNSTSNTGFIIRKVNATGRSINAAGTINASGADYAEYMTKAGDFVVAKGDVVGINSQGKLTNVFADAVSFCVKSTDPSYVGGDTWGNEDAVGQRPAPNAPQEEQDAFEAALEAARQTVDRIAFAGQVPVNVLGATAGQYIIPVNDNGAIKGEAVSNPTFEQYQIAVGKVIAIEQDGRAKIIVKVA